MGCSLFELLSRSEVGFVHEIKFIGSRAVDPSVEDSLAFLKHYRPMTNFANPQLNALVENNAYAISL